MYVCTVSGAVSKQLVRIDSKYAALFNDGTWKEATADRLDMSARFGLYTVESFCLSWHIATVKYH